MGPSWSRPGLMLWSSTSTRRARVRDPRPAPRPAEPALGPRPGRLRAGQLHQDPRLPRRVGVTTGATRAAGRRRWRGDDGRGGAGRPGYPRTGWGTRWGVRAEVTWAQGTSGPAGRRERRPDPGRTSRPRGRRRHALAGHGRPTPVYPYGRRVPGPDRQWRLRRLGRHRAQHRAHVPPSQPLAAHVAKPYLNATLRGGPAGQRGRPCRSASTDLAIRRCRVSSVLAPVT